MGDRACNDPLGPHCASDARLCVRHAHVSMCLEKKKQLKAAETLPQLIFLNWKALVPPCSVLG